MKAFQVFTGVDLIHMGKAIRGFPYFVQSAVQYSHRNKRKSLGLQLGNLFPVLHERFDAAGTAQGQYFFQDIWAARLIWQRRPSLHIDIGSRIDGFVAHLLVFMPVTLIDIRRIDSDIDNLSFIQEDATRLSSFPDNSVESMSSLHAAEHFGLGRYSDPVDPEACFDFMRSMARVLAAGGHLYFSVPIGVERVQFNAHRVLAVSTVLEIFADLKVVSFAYIDDGGRLHENADHLSVPKLMYGCGLFEFTKE